jgi:beta-lactamase regulating signal transducer with metallopeptidase domain/outer membrane lipoprotein-sorting protein
MNDDQLDIIGLMLLRGTLLLGAFWAVWAVLRNQPRARVVLCRAISIAVLAVPFLSLMPVRPMLTLPASPIREVLLPPLSAPLSTAVTETITPPAPPSTAIQFSILRALNWLPLAWLAGSVFLLVRWRGAWLLSRERVSRSLPATPAIDQLAESLSHALGLRARATVRLMKENGTPVLLGPQPVILIPSDLVHDEMDLASSLAHELVHVKERDWWWSQWLHIVQALLWPLPPAWFLRRAHDHAAEIVCDSIAAPLAGGSETYAGTLARQGLRAMGRPQLATIPMARSSDLRQRLDRLLSGLPLPGFSRGGAIVTWLAIVMASTILVAVGFATRPGTVTYRADESPNQAFGWNDHRMSDILLPPSASDVFEIVKRDGHEARTFSGKVVVHGPLDGVEVGLISLVDIHWINPDAYQWQPVAADGSFSITDTRYLDADKALVVRGPDTPWTFLHHNFPSTEGARNIVLKADLPEHVHLTASGVDGKILTQFRCEVFPYAQYDEHGTELRRQRSGMFDSNGKDSIDLVLPPDNIALFCGADGYARFYQVIDPRKVHAVHLVLVRAGELKITVLDKDGKPKAGVHASWQSDDAPLSLDFHATNANGVIFAKGQTPSTFVVTIAGFPDQRVDIKPDQVAEVTFREGHATSVAAPLPAPATTSAPAPSTTDSTSGNPSANALVKQASDTYAALKSYSDNGTVTTEMGAINQSTTFTIRLQRPSLYRVAWQGSLGKGVVWSDGTGDFLRSIGLMNEKQKDREMALASATGISEGAASDLPGTFFDSNWGGNLKSVLEYQLKPDESVDQVACHVVTGTMKSAGMTLTSTIWIGQQDHLIHKIQQVSSGAPALPKLGDSELKSILENQNKPATPEAISALRTQLDSAQDMVKTMLQKGGFTFTQIHQNIETDKTFAPADFQPEK